MSKKSYTVTEKAGFWVAGRRSPGVNKTLDLTVEQAHYALIAGELAEPETQRAPRRKPETSVVAE